MFKNTCTTFLKVPSFVASILAMPDSAILKIDWAAKHVTDLNEMLREKRPFSYIIETNTHTRQRSVGAEKNESVVNSAALMCGDVVHSLRTALDHVFWRIVSPRASKDEWERIQFPFPKTKAGFEKSIQYRLAQRAGTGFYCSILRLRHFDEAGGNELLSLVNKLDILDKHRLLIPTANYTELSGAMIRNQVPDFPVGRMHSFFSGTRYDVTWPIDPRVPREQFGSVSPPTLHIFKRELDIPVQIILHIGPTGDVKPLVPTLNALVDVTREVVNMLTLAAYSY